MMDRERANDHAGYDASDDVTKSIEEAYRAIRARVAAGGPSWQPKVRDHQGSAVDPAKVVGRA
jgi:hypothetical protein